jgi:hypothetical protein
MRKYLFLGCFLLVSGIVYTQTAPTKDKVSQAAKLLSVSESDLQKWIDSKFVSIPIGIPEITAEQLYKEYEASQPRADRAYKGKQIKITGTVGAIEEAYDTNFKKRYALTFKSSVVQVFFDDSDIEPLFDIAVGQKVSIVGILIQKELVYIVIDHAKIVK